MSEHKEAGRRMALEYRVWCFCEEAEWNVSISEIAEELSVSVQAITGVCRRKGWTNRLRVTRRDDNGFKNTGHFGMGGPEDSIRSSSPFWAEGLDGVAAA